MGYIIHFLTPKTNFNHKEIFDKSLNKGYIKKLYLFEFEQQDINKINNYLFTLKVKFNIILRLDSYSHKYVFKYDNDDDFISCIHNDEDLLMLINIMNNIASIIKPETYKFVLINSKLFKLPFTMYGIRIYSYICTN